MAGEPIPEDVRRFILMSIPSVSCLEAILLLRGTPEKQWHTKCVGQRLYVNDKLVEKILRELCEIGVLEATSENPQSYRYRPSSDELRQMIDRLAVTYASNLVEVTNLIHSGLNKKAQQFADAFIWRRD